MAVALSTITPGSFFSITPSTAGLPVAKYLLTAVTAQQAGYAAAWSLDQHRVVELDETTQVDAITPTVASSFTYSV